MAYDNTKSHKETGFQSQSLSLFLSLSLSLSLSLYRTPIFGKTTGRWSNFPHPAFVRLRTKKKVYSKTKRSKKPFKSLVIINAPVA